LQHAVAFIVSSFSHPVSRITITVAGVKERMLFKRNLGLAPRQDGRVYFPPLLLAPVDTLVLEVLVKGLID